MLRTVFAIGIAGLILAGGSGTTQAAPILPLPAAATAGLDNLTDVQWGRRCWLTAGDECVVAVAGAAAGALALAGVPGVALAGALAGVATAGVTAGAVCVAGGDSNLLT
jgi:hypothetical protein